MKGLVRLLDRWMRYACAVATLVTLAAPAALGPAMVPMLDRLGAMHEHVCKCGMKPGKCGCPECDRAEQERVHAHGRRVAPILKAGCGDDAPTLRFAALPFATLAPASALLPAPRGERLPRAGTSIPPFDHDLDPPTPPPRLASV